MKPNFGNGGEVATLITTASNRCANRMSHHRRHNSSASSSLNDMELLPCDFKPIEDVQTLARKANPISIFDDLIGCHGIKQEIESLLLLIEDAKADGRDPLDDIELNFKFVGPPGTGKTTVARRMGQLFESLGLISTGETFVECKVSDLQGQYVGQTAPKTREKFKEAKGGVLFIDEAYRLYDKSGSSYMKECVDEIVNILTEEEFKGKLVVIFAGYEKEINEMMSKVNPGLSSRVTQTIKFEKFNKEITINMLKSGLKKKNKMISSEIQEACLFDCVNKLVKLPNFASGRDIETWTKRIILKCAQMKVKTVSLEMLKESVDFITSDKEKTSSHLTSSLNSADDNSLNSLTPLMQSLGLEPSPPPPISNITTRTADPIVEMAQEVAYDTGGNGDDDDDDDDIRAALQKACVDLGYDKDLQTRQKLASILTCIEKEGKPFPEDILHFIRQEVGGVSDQKIDKVLRPQVPSLLSATQGSIQYELKEIARLKALSELERLEAIKVEKKIQKKLRGHCPVGFAWHREGEGWRCGGGAHWVPSSEVE